MKQNTKTLADYLDIVKRRKYYFIIICLLVSITSVIVAFKLPKIYRSTATMLFEAPIPTKLFEKSESQLAEEQLQSIFQRVMTTDNILSILEKNGLYSDFKEGLTKYELAQLFKKNTEVKLSTSSLTPKINSDMAEIAFDVSFSYNEAIKAQEIARQLTALFIEQNDRARTQRAIKATEFLMDESEKLNGELQEIDRKIAQFKEQNRFNLPEQMQANLASIDHTESELRDTDSQIRETKERVAFLTVELARIQQELPVNPDSKTPQNREEALRVLRTQYQRLSEVYYPLHPAMLRLKSEIQALDPTFDGQLVEEGLSKQLAEAKRELKLFEETGSDDYKNIAKLRKNVSELEQKSKNSLILKQEQGTTTLHTTNPAYLAIEAQYKSSQSELESLIQKQAYLKDKIDKVRHTVEQAPQVEIIYKDLIRDRDNAAKKYSQLKEKWLDAKLVQTMEKQQQGQNLIIIEQPVLPLHPEKTIKRYVVIGGFIFGIFGGLGVAFFVEFLDPGIRGYRAITDITGLMPLIVVPYFNSPSELEEQLVKRGHMRKIIGWGGITIILLVTVVVFIIYMPFSQT